MALEIYEAVEVDGVALPARPAAWPSLKVAVAHMRATYRDHPGYREIPDGYEYIDAPRFAPHASTVRRVTFHEREGRADA